MTKKSVNIESEEHINNLDINQKAIPTVLLKGITLFPNTKTMIDILTPKAVQAIEEVEYSNKEIFCVTQKNIADESPSEAGLYHTGILCKIVEVIRTNNVISKVIIHCVSPAKLVKVVSKTPFVSCEVESFSYNNISDYYEEKAYSKKLKDSFYKYLEKVYVGTPALLYELENAHNPNNLINIFAFTTPLSNKDKNILLQETDCRVRAEYILNIIEQEIIVKSIENNINKKVKKNLDKAQKDYYLKEKVKVIQEELGNKNSITKAVEEFRQKIEELKPPQYVVNKLEEELLRLEAMNPSAQDVGNLKEYITKVLSLPWGENASTKENTSVVNAKKVLNEDHYGLEKVKERILEHIAVSNYANNVNSSIICLVGPPGVGKTSIAKSIATATNRNYVRMALGGVSDESEIRGHRRTYLGATWGRIMYVMKQSGTSNPLILLDEIDKINKNHKGDPASALLEVLDPEQNKTFRDNYLELDYDLSKCLFVCTANTLQGIPTPLLDRMEIINLSTYTDFEKINIAKSFLLPKQLKNHNLTTKDLNISKTTLKLIINNYTLEAGVRNLEKAINKICRKVVVEKLSNKDFKKVTITSKNICDYLGPKRELKNINIKTDTIGKVHGLAYTSYGGTVLPMEFAIFNGVGKISFTGNIGKVMNESSQIAISYLRSKATQYGYEHIEFPKADINIHVPEGATPKDGPSAGLALTIGLYSILTEKKVKANIAMTGEISMLGDVLPIGGVKEKILAGKNYGIKKFLLPEKNRSTYEDLDDYIKDGIEVVFVTKIDEALEHCF